MEDFPLREMLAPYERNRETVDQRIRQGIEAHRKRDASIRLTDKAGRPVEGARVTLTQKSHAFGLGCNLFMLDELETPEKNEAYKRVFADTFNMATLPFYWNTLEPEPGKLRFTVDSPRIYRRPVPDLCVEFCQKHGITPKLHCLNAEGWPTPDWVPRDSAAATKGALEKRFSQIAERYADSIPCIEVTNETLIPRPDCTPLYLEDDMVSWSFHTARRYFPKNELVINDGTSQVFWDFHGEIPDESRNRFLGNRSKYYMQIERELAHGTPIDAVGLQYHLFIRREKMRAAAPTVCDPLYLFALFDKYAQFGLPLQITETTLPAYSGRPEDEEAQAELLRMFYSVCFAHPAMEAVIYWNLPDGYAAFAEPGDMAAGENYYHGGLLRFDMSEKPALTVLRDLFRRQWHTNCTLTTDGEGRCAFRGFLGKYAAVIEKNGRSVEKTVCLSREGASELRLAI